MAENEKIEAVEKAVSEASEVKKDAAEEIAATDDTAAKATEEKSQDEKTPKKKGKAGKVILTIVGILLLIIVLIAAAGCAVFGSATADNLPEAPSNSDKTMSDFAIEAAAEVISKKPITASSEDIDIVLAQVKESVNNSTDIMQIEDLFCELADGKGTLYARINVAEVEAMGMTIPVNKTIPVQADFEISFEAPEVVVTLGDIKCGKIKIPQTIVDSVLAKVTLPAEMRTENGIIYYDTTTLDSMVDAAISDAVNSNISNNTIAGLLSNALTKFINVNIEDAQISGDELLISASLT